MLSLTTCSQLVNSNVVQPGQSGQLALVSLPDTLQRKDLNLRAESEQSGKELRGYRHINAYREMTVVGRQYHGVSAEPVYDGTDKVVFKAQPNRLRIAGEHSEYLLGVLRT